MDVHRVVDVATVAASHRDRDRQIARRRGVEDEAVAAREAVETQREAAEPISCMRISARQVDDERRSQRSNIFSSARDKASA